MTLEGAKFICLDEAGNHGEIVLAKGRKFTMGYYVSCDFVLVDDRAKGVHCEIECDAFGRVTIRNLSPDEPILVNGSCVGIKRILLNNSIISVLGKEYLWVFSKSYSNEFDELLIESVSTPGKISVLPEQPPNSCPDFKLHRELPKRFTVHNFAYCIQSDDNGNISTETIDENTNQDTETVHLESVNELGTEAKQLIIKNTPRKASQETNIENTNEKRGPSETPESITEGSKSSIELLQTPKMNLINCTTDKENKSTERKNMQLSMCHQSDFVITSFSPRETGVKIEKSFAFIIKPKVLETRTPSTPKSVYSTPKNDMNANRQNDESEIDLLTFYTPSTSRMAASKTAGTPTGSANVLKNSSMHLIDLTTPKKLWPADQSSKSASKASVKSNNKNAKEQLGTPVITEASNSTSETSSSVINVSSSIDISNVIELTSDGSNIEVTPSSVSALSTPLKAQVRIGTCTPKRTPQSLIKRALLTSAKKQNATPEISIRNLATPRRELATFRGKSAVTPQTSTGNLTVSQLSRRQSMSTPTRKGAMPAYNRFVNSSISNLGTVLPSTSEIASRRRSSLNPISAAKILPTSTPVSASGSNTICKTSPLHKVRKTVGGIPLSSHISKAHRSIVLAASSSKRTSIKAKSPQQVMSGRLLTKARKGSLCATPTSIRSRKMLEAAKTPTTVFKGSMAHTSRKSEVKISLFSDKPLIAGGVDNLSRTFIIHSDDEENNGSKEYTAQPKNATFSPGKSSIEIENSIKNLDIKEMKNEQQTIEIPVDVEEVTDLDKENRKREGEDKNQTNNKEEVGEKVSSIEECSKEKTSNVSESENKVDDNKENNAPLAEGDNLKTIVSEESFAEVINESKEQNNITSATVNLSDGPKEPSSFAEAVEEVMLQENIKCIEENPIETSNQDIKVKTDAVETGFGEESIVEASQSSCSKTVGNDEEIRNKKENYNRPALAENISQNNKSEQQQQHIRVDKSDEERSTDADIITEKPTEAPSLDAVGDKNNIVIEENPTEATSLVEEEVKSNFDLKVEEREKAYKYKPIVEDITLEGSVIEKESGESEEVDVSKQTLYEEDNGCLNTSLNEENYESKEAAKEIQDTEEVLSTSTKISEVLRNQDMEGETSIKNTDEMPTDAQKDVITSVDDPIYENIEVSETTQKLQDSKFEPSEVFNVYEKAFYRNVEKTDKKISEITEDFKTSHSHALTVAENISDNDLEDTNKLLEEIENVLNKSDEIEQKHLIESGKSNQVCETPLTENSELGKRSEEIPVKLEEIASFSRDSKKMGATNENDKHVKPSEEKASDNVQNALDSQSLFTEEENAKTDTFSQIEPTTSYIEENTKLCLQQDRESKNSEIFEQVVKSEQAKEIEGNIVSQPENNNLNTEITDLTKTINEQRTIEKEESIEVDENIGTENNMARNGNIPKNVSNQSQNNAEISSNKESTEEVGFQQKGEEQVDEFDEPRQGQDSKCSENVITPSEVNETDKKTSKGNIASETEKSKELDIVKKNIENAARFTPRRSTRCASQSNDTPQHKTPRSSTRRSSMSAELTATSTPTKRTTRRSSLSIVSETPLTSKQITNHRVLISGYDEVLQPSTSKKQRAKTPRKLLEQHMTIPEEMDVVVTAAIIEDEDEAAAEYQEQNTTIPGKQTSIVGVILEEEIVPESCVGSQIESRAAAEETILENPEISEQLFNEDIAIEISKREGRNDALMLERKEEIDDGTVLQSDLCLIEKQNTLENDPVEDHMNSIVLQGVINDNLEETEEKEHEELNNSSATQHEVDKVSLEEVSNCPKTSADDDIANDGIENIQILAYPIEELSNTSKTSPISGVPECMRISKSEAQTSSQFGCAHDSICTTEEKLECKNEEEFEKLSTVASLVKSPDTPERHVNILADSTKSDSVCTPICGLENEIEEAEEEDENGKLVAVADLVQTPLVIISKISAPKLKAESPKTPLMKGMRELLKTPKIEMRTPELTGICNLMQTPKSNILENVEELEKSEELAVVAAEIVETSEESKGHANIVEETPSTSMKTYNLKGVKELLRTPTRCSTPRLRGIRELMQTPKMSSTPIMGDVKELLEPPPLPEFQDLQANSTQVKSVLRESMRTPKTSTKEMGLEKFLKTPTAKNIMITSMPVSAVIEKSGDSIEIATECDLNATNDVAPPDLEELFKTTAVHSRFIERISDSYYDQDEVGDDDEVDKEYGERPNETLQDTLNKCAEAAFDKLVGQETQIHTPVRKIYKRRSFTSQTPTQHQSPFTTADVLSDLPKTDVEEWIETLDQAEQPAILECDDEETGQQHIRSEISQEIGGDTSSLVYSLNTSNTQNANESVIPETCNKIFISSTETKDPLSTTKETRDIVTPLDGEMSGINLLDQTEESVQDEPSMLDEALVVEEPSMFEEPLIVSDNESEDENTIHTANNHEISQEERNDSWEPLLLSESEDLNVSQDTSRNKLAVSQTEFGDTGTSGIEINVQEKSILENPSVMVGSLAEDPLIIENAETTAVVIEEDVKNVIEIDVSQVEDELRNKASSSTDDESISKKHLLQNVEHDSSEILELFSTSKTTEVSEISSTSKAAVNTKKELPSSNVVTQNISVEIDDAVETHTQNIDVKDISIEQTKVISVAPEDTLVTDMCEETSIVTKELSECQENIESKERERKVSGQECQDIFVDHSKIDESFADEAPVSEESRKTDGKCDSREHSLAVLADNDVNDSKIPAIVSDTAEEANVLVNEIIEFEEENIIIADIETSQVLEEESNMEVGPSETERNESEKSLPSQSENQPIETSEAKTKSSVTTSIIEIESSDEELVQNESIKADTQQKYSHILPETPKLKITNEASDIPKKQITKDTADTVISTENKEKSSVKKESKEECISQGSSDASEMFSEPTQSVIERVIIAELEVQENANLTTVLEVAQESLNDSSELKSYEALTQKAVQKTIDHSEQSSFATKDDFEDESKINKRTERNEKISSSEMEILEDSSNSQPGPSNIVKYGFEIKITDSNSRQDVEINAFQIVRRLPTVSASSQESDQGDEACTTSGKNDRKVIKTPSENKVEEVGEISEVIITNMAKEEGKITHTSVSDSVQGSVCHDKHYSTTSGEDKEKSEEQNEQRAGETTEVPINPIAKTTEEKDSYKEETIEESNKHISSEEIVTEKTADMKHDSSTEIVSDALQELKEEPVANLTEEQSGETVKVLTEMQEMEETKEIETQLRFVSAEAGVNETGNKTTEKLGELQSEDMLNIPKGVSLKNLHKTVVTEEKTLHIVEQQQKSNDSTENIVEVIEISTEVKPEIGKSDTSILPEQIFFSLSNQDRSKKIRTYGRKPKVSAETSQNAYHSRAEKFQRNAQKTPIEEVEVEKILDETGAATYEMGLEKQNIPINAEELIQPNVQTTPIEEVVVEDILDKVVTATYEISLETENIPIETTNLIEPIDAVDEQIAELQNVKVEVQKQIQRRGRRKATVSESSQSSIQEDDTSRTRRGRRKLQKTPIEEIVIEDIEKQKPSDLLPSGKTEEKVSDMLLSEKINEKDQQEKGTDENKIVPLEETNRDINKDHKGDSKIIVQYLKEISTQDLPSESVDRNVPLQEQTKNVSVDASKNIVDKRGKKKPILQQAILEKPTTSRRGRRNVQVSTENEHSIESKAKVVSEMKTSEDEYNKGDKIVQETKEQQEVDTKRTTKRARQAKKEVTENLIETVGVASSVITSYKEELESIHNDLTAREIDATSSAEQQDKTEEQTDKEMHGDESFTKHPAKSVRIRKVDLEEISLKKDANSEDSGEVTTSYTTRRARRQKIAAPETGTTVPPKGRSTNRNRKTPVELSMIAQQHEPPDANQKQEKPVKETSIVAETTEIEDTKVPNKSEKAKTHTESLSFAQDKQIKSQQLVEISVVDPTTSKEQESLNEVMETHSVNEKRDTSNIVALEKSAVEDPTSSKRELKSDGVKKRPKRNRACSESIQEAVPSEKPIKKRTKHQMIEIEQDHEERGELIDTKLSTSPEIQKSENIQCHDDNVEIKMDIAEKPQKSTRRRGGMLKSVKHHEEETIKFTIQPEQEESEKQFQSVSSGRTKGKKKAEQKYHDEQIPESNEKDKESIDFKNSGDTINNRNMSQDLQDHDDQKIGDQNEQPQQPQQEEVKKGRSRKKKIDQKIEEHEESKKSHSPDTKQRSSRRKQPNTDSHDPTARDKDESDEKINKDSETDINIASATDTERQTSHRVATPARKDHKFFEHITAESQEPEPSTPSRRARNVPQRRAATAYHNYDETSDSEILTKVKKKTDSPKNSAETVKKLPTATIASIPVISASPSTMTLTTTARGRTRKPTAKVQQFLEEERAKAETPKKRALLAAAAGIDGQRTPARRGGRKPSNIEVDGGGTPQANKGRRGKGKLAVSQANEPTTSIDMPKATSAVVEEREIELQTTPPPQPAANMVKERKGGRKAKIIEEEEHHNTDESVAKKSPLEVQSEKQDSSTAVETPTPPTRVAGKRNAAAAAKARIEEDALAEAAIEPPKRARTKRAPAKISTPVASAAVITDTDTHNSEIEVGRNPENEKSNKQKSSSQTREHRLASASTVEGIEDLEDDVEMKTVDKPTNKRRRKAATAVTTDSPAVSIQKGRKAKIVEGEVADMATPVESKTSRSRARGRKNAAFDEQHVVEAAPSSQPNTTDIEPAPAETSEPAKKVARTRRK